MFLEDFIYVNDRAFTKEFCEELILDFEQLKSEGRGWKGLSGAGDDDSIKKSYDMNVLFEPELSIKYEEQIVNTFNEHLTEKYLLNLPYQDKYSIYQLLMNLHFLKLYKFKSMTKMRAILMHGMLKQVMLTWPVGYLYLSFI